MSRRNLSWLLSSRTYVCPRCAVKHPPRQARQSPFHTSRRFQQKSVLELLEERGYVNQLAGDRNVLKEVLRARKVGFYAGIDPTAPSLHLGHLLPLMVLFWLYRHGHHVVSLVGGATAKVGDPSGRLTSRARTTDAAMQANFEGMFAQVGQLWTNALHYSERHRAEGQTSGTRELLNNAQWLDNLNVLEFLKTMGNGIRLGALLGRDTVRNKMEKGDGMSFSEFTYPLLQAWDWWQMYQDRAVQVQIGGSDQYGNIIAGIDAVRYIAQSHRTDHDKARLDSQGRLREELSPMGLTVPLLTTSSGEKFGKSAGNAVWLDRNLTSPFDLYGFLLRSTDADVERYLKLFTFVPVSEITIIMNEHKKNPGARRAQHLLAGEVIELVHGPEDAAKARDEHQVMRKPTIASISGQPNSSAGAEARDHASAVSQRIRLPHSLVYDTPLSRVLYHAGLVASKSEGARTVAKGAVYAAIARPESTNTLEFAPVKDLQASQTRDLVQNGVLVLRLGKWKVRVIEVVPDTASNEADRTVRGYEDVQVPASDPYT